MRNLSFFPQKTAIGTILEIMTNFGQFFDIQMVVFRRVYLAPTPTGTNLELGKPKCDENL